MAGPNTTLNIIDQEDLDLKYHLNCYSHELDGADNPLLCLTGNSLYHDAHDLKITKDLMEHKHHFFALLLDIKLLSAKFDKINLLSDFILLCDAFL